MDIVSLGLFLLALLLYNMCYHCLNIPEDVVDNGSLQLVLRDSVLEHRPASLDCITPRPPSMFSNFIGNFHFHPFNVIRFKGIGCLVDWE